MHYLLYVQSNPNALRYLQPDTSMEKSYSDVSRTPYRARTTNSVFNVLGGMRFEEYTANNAIDSDTIRFAPCASGGGRHRGR